MMQKLVLSKLCIVVILRGKCFKEGHFFQRVSFLRQKVKTIDVGGVLRPFYSLGFLAFTFSSSELHPERKKRISHGHKIFCLSRCLLFLQQNAKMCLRLFVCKCVLCVCVCVCVWWLSDCALLLLSVLHFELLVNRQGTRSAHTHTHSHTHA